MTIRSPEQFRRPVPQLGPLVPDDEAVVLAAGEEAGFRREASYGPIDGSPAVWAVHHYPADAAVAVDRQRLPLLRPDIDVLRRFLAASLGVEAAETVLRQVGPLDRFYQRYRAEHPAVAARGRQ